MLIAPWNVPFISDRQPLQKLAQSRYFCTHNLTTDGNQPKGIY